MHSYVWNMWRYGTERPRTSNCSYQNCTLRQKRPYSRLSCTDQPINLFFLKNTAILSTGGVLLYLPHHLDLASEDSVGHSTCMSVLARRRAIMGSIVQPKRSCLGLSRCCHVLFTVHAGASQGYVLGIPLYPTGRSST